MKNQYIIRIVGTDSFLAAESDSTKNIYTQDRADALTFPSTIGATLWAFLYLENEWSIEPE